MSVKQRAKFIMASPGIDLLGDFARLGFASLHLAWPTGTPTCTPREQIEIQLCGSTPEMAGQFPAAAANDQLP